VPFAAVTGQKTEAWKILRSRIATSIIALDRQRVRSKQFRYLVRLNDPNRLQSWLAKRSPEEKAFFESYRNAGK